MELKWSGAVVQLTSHAQMIGACVEEYLDCDNDDLDLGVMAAMFLLDYVSCIKCRWRV